MIKNLHRFALGLRLSGDLEKLALKTLVVFSNNNSGGSNGPIFDGDFDFKDDPQQLKLMSRMKFWIYPQRLKEFFVLAGQAVPPQLDSLGQLEIEVDGEEIFLHGEKSVRYLKKIDPKKIKLSIDHRIKIAQVAAPDQQHPVMPDLGVLTFGPMLFSYKGDFANNSLRGEANAQLQKLLLDKTIAFDQSNAKIKIDSFFIDKKQGKIGIEFKGKKYKILKSDVVKNIKDAKVNIDPLMQDIAFKSKIVISPNMEKIAISDSIFDLGNGLMTLSQRTNYKQKEMLLISDGVWKFKSEKPISLMEGLDLQGEVNVPWQLIARENKRAYLLASMGFKNFNIKKDLLEVRGIEGAVKLKEELKLQITPKEKSIEFSYLNLQNPFERVDFVKIRPLINTTTNSQDATLRIDKIRFKDLHLDSLEATFLLEQNLMTMKSFQVSLLDGMMAGAFFLDFYPKTMRAGFLGRITGIDPGLLTKKSSANNSLEEKAVINARSAMVVDFNKRLIEGRMDVTEIGKRQLIGFMNYLDPSYQNESMNNARTALGILAPTKLEMSTRQGLMDMEVGLASPLFSQTIKISNIPISGFVQSGFDNIMNSLKEVPIK
ncbi:MAG: hypothetical protein HQK53_12405 [Oligoflexia bacterium]|nr:hypothetical protein [Oligoflexia bacterium]